MKSSNFSIRASAPLCSLLLLPLSLVLAQAPGAGNIASVNPERLTIQRGQTATVKTKVSLRSGFHANSNKPADDFLIPLKLTWPQGPIEAAEVDYPEPKLEKYEFSQKPISVVTGDFEIVTKFKAPASAPQGMTGVTGKLRYQACTDKMCLPPKTVDVPLIVEIR